MFKQKITDDVKAFVGPFLFEGALFADLTAGNGYDTLFLAEGVGETGRVYAFDIQASALQKTGERLKEQGLIDRVSLIHDSHERIKDYCINGLNGAMMNLGYLPGGDKSLITKSETTITALKAVLELLLKDGIISIVVYSSHEGGQEEKEQVDKLIEELDDRLYQAVKVTYVNRKNQPPFIYLVHKRESKFLQKS